MNYVKFPEPPVPGAWTIQRPEWSYLLPWVSNYWQLVLLLAFQSRGGPAKVPPLIADGSQSDGDTPKGRHPGNAHDGGINLDRGYAMTENPRGDHSVGFTRIVRLRTRTGKIIEGPQLAGPPEWMDRRYEASVWAHAAIIDREWGGLIQNGAVDPLAEGPLENEIDTFSISKVNDRAVAVKRRAKAMLNSSDDVSWAIYHANHSHVRMYLRRDADLLAATFEKRVRTVTRELVGS